MKTPLILIVALLSGCVLSAQNTTFQNITVKGTANITGTPLSVGSGGTGASTFAANSILTGNGGSAVSSLAGTTNQILGTNGGSVPTFFSSLPAAVQANITAVSSSADLLVHSISSGVAGIGNSGDFSGKHFVPTTDNGSGFQIGAQTFRFNLGFFGQGGIVIGGDGSSNNGATITATGTAPNETLVVQGHGTGTLTLGKLTGASAPNEIPYSTTSGIAFTGTGTTGQVLTSNGSGSPPTFQAGGGGGGGGGVTSVGMTVPTFLSVTPSTITTSGTFVVTLSGTPLAVGNGGTGQNSFASGGLLYGNGSGAISSAGPNATLDGSGNFSTAGNISFQTPGDGIVGGVLGTSPTVGNVGYSSGVGLSSGTPVSLSNGVVAVIVSHNFPAGSFEVSGSGWFINSGSTTTVYVAAISTSPTALPGVNSAGENQTSAPISAGGFEGKLPLGPVIFRSSIPFTLYLIEAADFSGGTMAGFGGMSWLQIP